MSQPFEVKLVGNRTYYWCSCGKSKNQPFCDGSHKGSGKEPHAFSTNQTQSAWLCVCKKTANPPYCDGSHKK